MKKALAFLTLFLGCVAMFAQSGPTFPYQAVVRNSQNQLIKESTFNIDVEVYQGTELKYSETQSVTTNANGQFTMSIGGGTVVSGAMTDVADWSVAKFKITYHLSEGDIVSEDAVSPVPYALQAANNSALTELLNAMNARMDSLGRLVDSLSNLNHGGGTTAFTCGTSKVKDVDGNEYNTVQIGNQCWMAQNLRTKTHQYGNVWTKSDADSAIYGRYYDWAAVMQGESGSTVQGICPVGWHVPSDADWDTLTDYVNTEANGYRCNGDGTIAKALSQPTGWSSNTSEGCYAGNRGDKANATGFSAVPAGHCSNGGFSGFGGLAYVWSATQYGDYDAWCRILASNFSNVLSVNASKDSGSSVRCLRDAGIGGGTTPSAPATMSCEDVMNCLGDTLGRLNARITSQGAEIETLNGTVASQGETITAQANTIDSLNHIVDSLANLPHGGGDEPATFTCGTSKVKDVDNNEYNTVAIGNQCWMKENLRTKTLQYGRVWTKTDVDSAIYGRYYDWQAAMQIEQGNSTSYTAGDKHRGICPAGWHVPSDAEWTALTDYVNTEANGYRCNGDGTIAKALSQPTGWSSNTNEGCNAGNRGDKANATGFSAVPAGLCFYGSFDDFGDGACFWSATQDDDFDAWCRGLYSNASYVVSSSATGEYGYSVRCVRN